MAFRFDWYGKNKDGSLERNWFDGGKVRIIKLVRGDGDRQVRLRGHQGQQDQLGDGADGREPRLDGSDSRRRGAQPDRRRQRGAPSRQPLLGWSLRMSPAASSSTARRGSRSACISRPRVAGQHAGQEGRRAADTGRWSSRTCHVGHECGFSPDGKNFTMTNNTRQNNMAVFDSSDADPRKWKRVAQ